MKVCIDPGHGGTDPGAVSNGYLEKDLTLKVSLELKKFLTDNGIQVVMTREDDENLRNDVRISRVKNSDADICISIHFNASNSLGRGTETIYQINNENSEKLAKIVVDKISSLGICRRRAYYRVSTNNSNLDYYFMLRCTRPVTSIIVECLFIDNEMDIKFLETDQAINKLAEKIGNEILEYLEIINRDDMNVKSNNEYHWSNQYLDKLYKIGLIQDQHNPNDIPTWGELATMITRTIEHIESSNKKSS